MITREQMPEGRIRLTFTLPAAEPAGDVSVVGDFNDWCPGTHPLLGEDEGSRETSIIVEPGTYNFRYLATGGFWFDDDHADAISQHGGVLHCHRASAPVEEYEPTDPTDVDGHDVAAAVTPESARADESDAATETSGKGGRRKVGAVR